MPVRGFTVVELAAVIVIVGLLAVMASPRFLQRQTFDTRGFSDQTVAALRYARQSALAQRRTVCVRFTPSSVALDIASAAGEAVCGMPLAGPGGQPAFAVSAPAGVAYATVPVDFRFDATGRPSMGQAMQVANSGTVIAVEAETGYVHR
jgi:MSHA pilin protein MshC